MCGIFGVWNLDGSGIDVAAVVRATTAIRHRGPDDEGYLLINTRSGRTELCGGKDTTSELKLPDIFQFAGDKFDLAFGFRRLSILDLSPDGHQPMASPDKREWIIFNGEIYNYIELRDELSLLGHKFHTGSDTEVILAAFRQWGEACVERFNGMFALALWDAANRTLFLARDRFGEKPIHYVYRQDKLFAFGSEMKTLWAANLAGRQVHTETLARFQHYGQLDAGDQTFYVGLLRLPQAHSLKVSAPGNFWKRRYWDIDPREQEDGKSDSYYSEQFRELLTDSVRLRLRADVPVGSSLSGGLDSSTIVSVINRLLPPDGIQKTFSARFDEPASDEGKWIDLVTRENRVQRADVWPTPEQFFDELTKVFWHQEEPFSSTSIYAQWCVMRLARENDVTVLLDGQGADEMLAGYHSYFEEYSADLLTSMNLPRYLKWKKNCRDLHGYAPRTITRVAKQTVPSVLKNPVRRVMRSLGELPQVERSKPEFPAEFKKLSSLKKQLWWNTTREGLVELLRYADRNSMAHSREVRLPFLDHRLVEFVFRLPDQLLMRDGWTKWILREAFRGIVPAAITDRIDKLGYMPPQKRWLGNRVWPDVMVQQLTEMDELPARRAS